MSRKFNLAVVGATGAVGEAMISILEEREFPLDQLSLLASERSVGKRIGFGSRQVAVGKLSDFDFKNVDIALFSAGAAVSREHAPRAIAAGCNVIEILRNFVTTSRSPWSFRRLTRTH